MTKELAGERTALHDKTKSIIVVIKKLKLQLVSVVQRHQIAVAL